MKVFLDTNVVLDVIARREPFAADAAMLWALAETRKVTGFISALSFATVYYIARRTRSRAEADGAMRLLRDVFTPATCDAAVIHQAIDAGFSDFEDAIQYFSAAGAGVDYIVTRDTDHFAQGQLPVLTPREFLAMHAPQ